ncbi:hypothetical protein PR202_gb11281 [Eleusine coracana subsp. coracana]|uniref:Glycosyltransferase n=1 Tax=Eleusine coracana subsp. coracana TaxID=191504 RepID=A0AAV5EMN1_ELECO|nr:hypothetical protein PR202_gb11281 [Eleusine coracana subsp. coracana]
MDSSSSSSPLHLHVVICPWLAFGHLLPCLDLAERLASRGHRVSYVSTPRNIARLPPVRPDAAALVEFVALPFPRVEGLAEGAESTKDVPFDKVELLWKAFDDLAAPFAEFMRAACSTEGSRRPDWIIADMFTHWAGAAALEHKLPCAMLILTAARNVAAWDRRMSRRAAAAGVPVHERPAAPRRELEHLKTYAKRDASGMSFADRCALTHERCSLVAVRSCLEWEPESLPLAATLGGKPVVPLGLLPPSPDGDTVNGEQDATLHWLDAQPAGSVVYVALGSEVPLRVDQVHELAHGLERAGTRFLWALRKPRSVVLDDADVLPPGFEERTRGRGLVAMGWVPQIRILAHGAVGAFLTHCGWSSIIEGLQFGRPLIMLPIAGDQRPNSRVMESKNVGMQCQEAASYCGRLWTPRELH